MHNKMSTDIIPPKHIQQLYFQKEKLKSNASYSIGFDLLMKGEVKTEFIKSSLSTIVKKISAFSYRFSLEKDGIHQKRLSENNKFSWHFFDCSNETSDVLKMRILNEASLSINPEKGQNITVRLYKQSATDYFLSVTASHLVADARSMEILLKNFLAELKVQYLNTNQSEETLTIQSPGPIKVQQSYEVTKILYLSQFQNLKTLCRQENVSLFSILMAGLTTVPQLKTDSIGVLFSNRTQANLNEVGCFVQAVPIYLYERRFVLEMAKGVRKQVAQIQVSLKNKEQLPPTPGFNVMFSMVTNSDTVLHGPEGVSVEYLRRLHTKPECALHIYAYQYHDKLEIVFNFDPDLWDQNDLENMLDHYVENLNMLSDQKDCQSELFNKVESKIPEVRFDHVGIAVWEMDIGLLRLKADCNIDSKKRSVKDNAMEVELASFDVGIASQIELVAPLSKKAPCVGFLERLGEGPYHCCWQTTSLEKVLESLDHRAINYMVIDRYEQSALYPDTPILFLLVHGVGLIEYIEIQEFSDQSSEPLSIEIISNDLENAAKFFHILGFKPEHPAKATWQDSGRIFIKMYLKDGEKESFVYRISSIHHEINEIVSSSPQSLSDRWKRRVCI